MYVCVPNKLQILSTLILGVVKRNPLFLHEIEEF